MENGYGKRTDIEEYGMQGRGGQGIKTAQITAKTGKMIGGHVVKRLMHMTCLWSAKADRWCARR